MEAGAGVFTPDWGPSRGTGAAEGATSNFLSPLLAQHLFRGWAPTSPLAPRCASGANGAGSLGRTPSQMLADYMNSTDEAMFERVLQRVHEQRPPFIQALTDSVTGLTA